MAPDEPRSRQPAPHEWHAAHDWNLGPTGARGWIFGKNLETSDARKLFGAAIPDAEKTENHGLLQLQLWRKGATQKATVHLEVLGSYSDSSPENCPKTKRIVEGKSGIVDHYQIWSSFAYAYEITHDVRFLNCARQALGVSDIHAMEADPLENLHDKCALLALVQRLPP